jgi:hypothetical protein
MPQCTPTQHNKKKRKKTWYTYIVEYYSDIKKNEVMLFAGKWMELESMLSEVSLAQKDKGHMFSLICGR